jgi:hypothetical protein
MGSKIEVEGLLGEMFQVPVDRMGSRIGVLPVVFRIVEGLEGSNEIQEMEGEVDGKVGLCNRCGLVDTARLFPHKPD